MERSVEEATIPVRWAFGVKSMELEKRSFAPSADVGLVGNISIFSLRVTRIQSRAKTSCTGQPRPCPTNHSPLENYVFMNENDEKSDA